MIYGSACSGIEAASVAWESLGWRCAFLSEIEAFPRAVLKHRFPGVRLWGDFTALRARHFNRLSIPVPNVLVGGTPCQSFSIAGLRRSLDDDRGNLALEFVRLANAIDNLRRHRGETGLTVVWENVPGVLTTKDNAFGCFLAALVGHDAPLALGRGQRWTDSGLVVGPRRAAAWRVLDAQYFGLAQRRDRVFVVASPRDGADPAAILFEPEGLRRHSPPRREAGSRVATPVTESFGIRGQPDGGEAATHLVFGGNNTAGPIDISPAVNAHGGGSRRMDFETEALIVVFDTTQITSAANRSNPQPGDPCHPVTSNGHPPTIAFSCKDSGADASVDIAPTLRAMNHSGSPANAGGQVAICVTGDISHALKADGFDGSEDGTGRGLPIVCHALQDPITETDLSLPVGAKDTGHAVKKNGDVRRLMPVETERLQGFPDGWTDIFYRRKPAADGPRYRAIGNSMAVPVMAWLGQRIQMAEDLTNHRKAGAR